MKKAFASESAFKVYSVFIAILLWVFVVYNQNPQSTKVVDGISISYTNAAELENANLTILKQEREQTVGVTVKGRRLSIGKIAADNVSASVTIPSIHEGEYDVSIDTRLPIGDVSIVDKKPYTIKVVVEKLKRISVPVEIKYTGTLKDENSSVQATAMPQQISVWGPQSVIDTVSQASVTFNVEGAVDGQSNALKCRIVSKDGKDITNNPNINFDTKTIEVITSIYKTKDVPIEVKYTGQMPSDCAISSVEILPSKIRLGSKDDSVYNVEKVVTEPIDMSYLSQTKKIPVKLVIPEGFVNVFSVVEAEVLVNVEKSVAKTINVENVTFKNAASGKMYEANDLPAAVTLYGAKTVLDTLNINASVDVGGISEGTYILPLELDLPDGVTYYGSYSISVLVSDATLSQPTSAQ